jgi:hypothetical protein
VPRWDWIPLTRALCVGRRRGIAALAALCLLGCGKEDVRFAFEKKPIPEPTWKARAHPVGITPRGEAVVVREGRVETWALDGSGRRVIVEPARGRVHCENEAHLGHDKRSGDGTAAAAVRELLVAASRRRDRQTLVRAGCSTQA